MNSLFLGYLYYKGHHTHLSLKRGEYSVEEFDKTLTITAENISQINVPGIVILGDDFVEGVYETSRITSVNGVEITPLYEFKSSFFMCILQERESKFVNLDNNFYLFLKEGEDIGNLASGFIYIDGHLKPCNFNVYFNGKQYLSSDVSVYEESEEVLIDKHNYISDWIIRQRDKYPEIDFFVLDTNMDTQKKEFVKLTEISMTHSDSFFTAPYRMDLKTLTSQMCSCEVKFTYGSYDIKVFEERYLDYYQRRFISDNQSWDLLEKPIDVPTEYTCSFKDIDSIENVFPNASETVMYTFSFSILFVFPIYRKESEFKQIKEVISRVYPQ